MQHGGIHPSGGWTEHHRPELWSCVIHVTRHKIAVPTTQDPQVRRYCLEPCRPIQNNRKGRPRVEEGSPSLGETLWKKWHEEGLGLQAADENEYPNHWLETQGEYAKIFWTAWTGVASWQFVYTVSSATWTKARSTSGARWWTQSGLNRQSVSKTTQRSLKTSLALHHEVIKVSVWCRECLHQRQEEHPTWNCCVMAFRISYILSFRISYVWVWAGISTNQQN